VVSTPRYGHFALMTSTHIIITYLFYSAPFGFDPFPLPVYLTAAILLCPYGFAFAFMPIF